MRRLFRAGFSFGITSGIITPLGLIVGLYSGTHSTLVVIGGILIISIADAFSDAFGMHISKESEVKDSAKGIWEATIATFISKLVFALTFLIPVLLLPLSTAVIVSVIWGLSLICALSFFIAREERIEPWKVILEHLVIALLVIVLSNYVGSWIKSVFS